MSDEVHSPLEISIALHYWARVERYAWREPEHASSAAVISIKQRMVDVGLLRALPVPADDMAPDYEANDGAMRLYVEALCAVPFPVKKWAMP